MYKRKSQGKQSKGGYKKRKVDNNVVSSPRIWPPIADRQDSTGPEKKHIDTAPAIYQANTTAVVTLLNGCVRGTDSGERVGRKVTMTSVFVRGYCQLEESVSGNNGPLFAPCQLARLMIVYDRQPTGATPAITEFLNSSLSYAQLNYDNRDRFSIIADYQAVLGPFAVATTGVAIFSSFDNCGKEVNIYRSLRLPTIFNATNGGTVADINSGALWMVTIGNVAAGTDTDANFRVSVRVKYLDD